VVVSEVCVWFNPGCSKCRSARDLLDARPEMIDYFHYLDRVPTRPEIERVMEQLGLDDPRGMMRAGEDIYAQLHLEDADRDALIDAMVDHPILVERPIVIRGDRAVIARPPEKLFELF
jgi:arsenate reductase